MATSAIQQSASFTASEALKNGPGIKEIASWLGKGVFALAPESVKSAVSNAGSKFAETTFGQGAITFFEAAAPYMGRTITYAVPIIGVIIAVGVTEAVYGISDEYKASKFICGDEETFSKKLASEYAQEMKDEVNLNYEEKSRELDATAKKQKGYQDVNAGPLMSKTELALMVAGGAASVAVSTLVFGTAVPVALGTTAALTVTSVGLTLAARLVKKCIFSRRISQLEKTTQQLAASSKYLFSSNHQQELLKQARNKNRILKAELKKTEKELFVLKQKFEELSKQTTQPVPDAEEETEEHRPINQRQCDIETDRAETKELEAPIQE